MKLYMFEHCSLCFRVRMAAALKGLHLQDVPVLDDDTKTLTALAGKRVVPILVKDDGRAMLESMDMVSYIDAQGEPLFTGPEHEAISTWAHEAAERTAPLTWPRYPLLGLPEFGTVAALNHYNQRKRKMIGDFSEILTHTRRYIDELMPHLERLDGLIESPNAINGTLSRDDIRVLPLLRSAAVVKGLQFLPKIAAYFETMLARIGYAPLPVI